MVMPRDQNAGRNGNIQVGNKSFETVQQFKYMETTLTNQNSIHEEIFVSQVSPLKPCMQLFSPYTSYMPCPSESSRFDHTNYIW
jgi:hypothetical protein